LVSAAWSLLFFWSSEIIFSLFLWLLHTHTHTIDFFLKTLLRCQLLKRFIMPKPKHCLPVNLTPIFCLFTVFFSPGRKVFFFLLLLLYSWHCLPLAFGGCHVSQMQTSRKVLSWVMSAHG
jgi:hypothetical protein